MMFRPTLANIIAANRAGRIRHWALAVIACLVAGSAHAGDWYPVDVDVWEPPFNPARQRVTRSYVPLEKATRVWNLCALIPHLKDAYWLAVNYGLVAEARRLGVELSIYEAGGYERLAVQREQLQTCIGQGVDAVILSAISATGLNDLIQQATKAGIPVLDLINGVDSPDLAARTAVDFFDTGFQTGSYLKALHPDLEQDVTVAWFPGPDGAAWVAKGNEGFRVALDAGDIDIVASARGDTGKTAQATLIEAALEQLGADGIARLDYIVGTTVSAEAAVDILRRRGLDQQIRVLAYYYGPGVHRGIRRGSIAAAPTDSQAIQARMAVDTMVRLLEHQPFFKHAAPQVMVIDRSNQRRWDSSTTLAPRGFRPVFSVSPPGAR